MQERLGYYHIIGSRNYPALLQIGYTIVKFDISYISIVICHHHKNTGGADMGHLICVAKNKDVSNNISRDQDVQTYNISSSNFATPYPPAGTYK